LSHEGILREEQKYMNSDTKNGPRGTDGVSNYVLPIYASTISASPELRARSSWRWPSFSWRVDDNTCNPIALLYFLDSRGGSRNDPSNNDNIPNWVSQATASWFHETTVSAKARWGVLPSLVFVHIPVYAFSDLQDSAAAGVSGAHFPGLNADNPLSPQGMGAVGNNTYTGQDVPFMQALLETEGLHSVYSGHDHGDSWCGTWQSSTNPSSPSLNRGSQYAANGRPFLCFCKHSGFGGYGNWNRGVRHIQLSFREDGQMEVKTWVRMQWDTHPQVITSVTLNNTYGIDNYSTADGGYQPYS